MFIAHLCLVGLAVRNEVLLHNTENVPANGLQLSLDLPFVLPDYLQLVRLLIERVIEYKKCR